MERSRRYRLALLGLVLAFASAPAQAPTMVRLRDAVGDTIDLSERDSFRLFPNTAGFGHAVILAIPGPEFFAKVAPAGADTTRQIYLRIAPAQLERIRFLVDNRDYMAGQAMSDSTQARATAAFWREIEDRPLRNMAGDPAVLQPVSPAPTRAAGPGEAPKEQKAPSKAPEATPPARPAAAPESSPARPEATTSGQARSEPAPVVVRLCEAVGDTIDAAERDSFHLFPNTAGFHRAVVLALPGPEFFAEVTRADGDTVRPVYYIILPGQLKRIRFLIDNREYIAAQQRFDSSYAQAIAAFWQTIEEYALPSMTGEPVHVQRTTPTPPVTNENRFNYTLHGATVGSIAGGLIGSWIGIGDAVACGFTVAGSYVGHRYGSTLDRKSVPRLPRPWENQGWRTCCAIGAGVPALALGAGTVALVSEGRFTGVPAYVAGLCVAVEVVTLGYRLGRSIDR